MPRWLLIVVFIALSLVAMLFFAKQIFLPTADPSTLTRHYPASVKGAIFFGPPPMFRFQSQDLKTLGVNTIVVYAANSLRQGKYVPTHGEAATISLITQAKQAGFAVILAPEFWEHGSDRTSPIALAEHLKLTAERSQQWAKLAEKYQVEYFAPYNEFNGNIQAAFFGGYDGGVISHPEIVTITNDWHQELLAGIKPLYTGQTLAKLDPLTNQYDLSGYDLIGITLIHNGQSVENFTRQATKDLTTLAQVASASQAKWLVSEAFLEYGPPAYDRTENELGQSLDALQDEYYAASIKSYQTADQTNAGGYIFAGWDLPGAGIKDRPAQGIVKNFYQPN